MQTPKRRFDLSDAAVIAGVALFVIALSGVDWRLAVAVLGLILFAFGATVDRMRGGR